MTNPVILKCPDGHYRRAVFELGPFIADYPEQVLAAGVVQNWCPKYVANCHDAPEHALFFAFFSLLLRAFLSFISFMDFTLFQPFPGTAGGYVSLSASFVTWSHLTCC
jgi:hypothetical protein